MDKVKTDCVRWVKDYLYLAMKLQRGYGWPKA